jgi:hypothetical protein
MAWSTTLCQIIQRGLVQTSEISFILHFDNEKTKSCLSSYQYNPGEISDEEIYLHGCYAISQLTYIRLHCACIAIKLQCGGFNPPDINDLAWGILPPLSQEVLWLMRAILHFPVHTKSARSSAFWVHWQIENSVASSPGPPAVIGSNLCSPVKVKISKHRTTTFNKCISYHVI